LTKWKKRGIIHGAVFAVSADSYSAQSQDRRPKVKYKGVVNSYAMVLCAGLLNG
jgi:hypothetical protein